MKTQTVIESPIQIVNALDTADPDEAIAFVQRLSSTATDEIGFLPSMAIRRHVTQGLVLIVFEDAKYCGFLVHSPLSPNRVARIHQLCVARASRRRGYGSALYARFRDLAVSAQCQHVSLCCASDLAAGNAFWLAQEGLIPIARQERQNRRRRAVRYFDAPLQPCLFTLPCVN